MTTNPVSAAVAPTTAERSVVAVAGEYSQICDRWVCLSRSIAIEPSTTPSTAPTSGSSQRLPFANCRARKAIPHMARW